MEEAQDWADIVQVLIPILFFVVLIVISILRKGAAVTRERLRRERPEGLASERTERVVFKAQPSDLAQFLGQLKKASLGIEGEEPQFEVGVPQEEPRIGIGARTVRVPGRPPRRVGTARPGERHVVETKPLEEEVPQAESGKVPPESVVAPATTWEDLASLFGFELREVEEVRTGFEERVEPLEPSPVEPAIPPLRETTTPREDAEMLKPLEARERPATGARVPLERELRRRRVVLAPEDMRSAVILSEILGRPLALRRFPRPPRQVRR